MRFITAQFDALLTNDLWLDNAQHANAMAAQLAAAFGDVPAVEVMRAPQSNSVFARIPPQVITPLQDWSFFWPWDPYTGTVRWMTSFATTDDDVSRFVAGVRHLTNSPAHDHWDAGVERGVSAQTAQLGLYVMTLTGNRVSAGWPDSVTEGSDTPQAGIP